MQRRSFLLTPLLLPALATARDAPRHAVASRATRLSFPRDHGAHPEFRTEWWYVTGALDVPGGGMGFQLTFFRSRPGIAEELDSPIAASQILFAHAALTRPGQRLLHAERAARANLGAGFSTTDCDVHVGAWSMRRGGAGADEQFRLVAHDAAFAFDLRLTPTQPLLLQGEHGWSQKGPRPELASHYVSWPQLRVGGRLVVEGKTQEATGRAWFDHEWSSEVLAAGAVGWDWIGINLDDGGALMAFRIRDAGGNTLYAHASLRDADGRLTRFGAGEVAFTPIRRWTSPRNGAQYPVQMEIRVGPQRIETTPVADDQEISARRPLPVSYWEGLVAIRGTLAGRGYLELTGYAGALRL
ncbi:lipocalin-like domain-containing protein [Sulfuritalea sp.]|uniref:lipocalin-like domain-containing protein n=1 Tax=Sulfuritalea sp. TaxID=2480090 RepID=UPI001AC465AC|nr:lipocalin-like domain-containing protein [Sulfuritalea sp.]MBN8476761.1 carotenoid 1,2-hydratase [Sulfuritalea sp.]